MALNLSPREISRQLADSALTRADCALLRPLAQKSTLSIQELVSPVPCRRVVVSSPVKGGNAQNQGEASPPPRGEGAVNFGEAPHAWRLVNKTKDFNGMFRRKYLLRTLKLIKKILTYCIMEWSIDSHWPMNLSP